MKRSTTAAYDATANKGAPPPSVSDPDDGDDLLHPDEEYVEKRVRKVEEYVVSEPVSPVTRLVTAPPPPQQPEPPEPELSPIEEFLAQLRADDGYVIRIDRLPDYRITGQWKQGAKIVYCGEIPFSPETYMATLQMSYGAGDYRITLKTSGRRIMKSWVEQVEAARQVRQEPAGAPQLAPVYTPALQDQPAVDPLADLLNQVEKFGKIRKALGGWEHWEHEPPQSPPAPVPTAPERSLEEKIVEKVFDAALAGKREDVMDRILGRYLAPEKEEVSWTEILTALFKPLVEAAAPLVPALIGTYMRSTQPPGAPPVTASTTGVAAAPASLPPRPTAVPSPPMPEMGPHAFTGRSDQWCEVCNLPDRHPVHTRSPLTQAIVPLESLHEFVGVVGEPCQVCAGHWNAPRHGGQFVPPDPDDGNEAPQMDLIDQLVAMLESCIRQAVADPAVIETGYQEVRAFQERNPFLSAFVHSLANGSPEMVIGILLGVYPELSQALVGNPIAIEAIAALQSKLKGEDQ